MTSETVLVTGASSGIGRELAKLFAGDGADLVLVARSEQALRELADELESRYKVRTRVLPGDLSRHDAPSRIAAALEADRVRIDVLVNNAGFGDRGPVAAGSLDRQLGMIQVNVTALTHLTRLLVPAMIERAAGGVLNVASTAAFQPGPNMAIYYASKAYVLSFSEALGAETRSSGITVTCLAPGPTTTAFADRADMNDARLFRLGTMSAETVARAGHDGFRRRRVLVIPGLRNRLGAFAVRFCPRPVVRKVVAALNA